MRPMETLEVQRRAPQGAKASMEAAAVTNAVNNVAWRLEGRGTHRLGCAALLFVTSGAVQCAAWGVSSCDVCALVLCAPVCDAVLCATRSGTCPLCGCGCAGRAACHLWCCAPCVVLYATYATRAPVSSFHARPARRGAAEVGVFGLRRNQGKFLCPPPPRTTRRPAYGLGERHACGWRISRTPARRPHTAPPGTTAATSARTRDGPSRRTPKTAAARG